MIAGVTAKLPPPTGSAYGNPKPYAVETLERFSLEGRIDVQRARVRRAEQDGRAGDAARGRAVVDELLEHWPYARDRALSAEIDRVEWPGTVNR